MSKSNIVIVWTKNLGTAYAIFNEIGKKGCNILEISPIGLGGQIIFETQDAKVDLAQILSSHSKQVFKSELLTNLEGQVLKSYLSLELSPLKGSLWILESPFLGDSFYLANKALEKGCEIVDLRLMRLNPPKSILYLTGGSLHQDDLWREGTVVTHVTNPTEKLVSLFSI